MHLMTSFEWLTLVYLAGITAAGWGRRSPQRLRAAGYAALAIVLVIVACSTAPWAVRAWLPHAYLVLGYWLPAMLTPVPTSDGFQRRLAAAEAFLGSPDVRRLPAWVMHWFELSYLFCYPIVPISFSVVWARGTAEDVERFWIAVLSAGFACYGTLPWTAAWPPRLVSRCDHHGLAAVNVRVLQRVSHGFNTFPSGHVAVAVAASMAVATVSPAAGAIVGVVAASIAIAAAVGRYHYVVDVIAGVLVGLLAWSLTGDGRPV
jgi:membrane-associated phospholipid phosphatase